MANQASYEKLAAEIDAARIAVLAPDADPSARGAFVDLVNRLGDRWPVRQIHSTGELAMWLACMSNVTLTLARVLGAPDEVNYLQSVYRAGLWKATELRLANPSLPELPIVPPGQHCWESLQYLRSWCAGSLDDRNPDSRDLVTIKQIARRCHRQPRTVESWDLGKPAIDGSGNAAARYDWSIVKRLCDLRLKPKART